MKLNKENILESLTQVKDPDLHRNIVELGFVKNLTITGSNIKFDLQLTTPACPVRDQFIVDCEKAIRDAVEEVGKIDINMTSNVQRNTHAQKHAERNFELIQHTARGERAPAPPPPRRGEVARHLTPQAVGADQHPRGSLGAHRTLPALPEG